MPRPPLILGVQTMRGRFQGPIENPYLGYPEPARVGIGGGGAAVVAECGRGVAQDCRSDASPGVVEAAVAVVEHPRRSYRRVNRDHLPKRRRRSSSAGAAASRGSWPPSRRAAGSTTATFPMPLSLRAQTMRTVGFRAQCKNP